MKTIAEDIAFWAARKAKAEALPARVRERHRETYNAVCKRLQALVDAVFADAVAVIDTAQDAAQVNAAAAVMHACVANDYARIAATVAQYNTVWTKPLGFLDADGLPVEWKGE